MKHPKTTVAGVVTILIAILNPLRQYLSGEPVDVTGIIPAVTVGIGLILASDSKK